LVCRDEAFRFILSSSCLKVVFFENSFFIFEGVFQILPISISKELGFEKMMAIQNYLVVPRLLLGFLS
jgi:hypothetical protein